ncbi:hypothetical protein BDR03DRAFT_948073 [Suillus americanus]|nr:hypothetical protein BDR03DRAFT_948073 [Suillus americanus]
MFAFTCHLQRALDALPSGEQIPKRLYYPCRQRRGAPILYPCVPGSLIRYPSHMACLDDRGGLFARCMRLVRIPGSP